MHTRFAFFCFCFPFFFEGRASSPDMVFFCCCGVVLFQVFFGNFLRFFFLFWGRCFRVQNLILRKGKTPAA